MSQRVIFLTNPKSQGVRRKGSRLKNYHNLYPKTVDGLIEISSESATMDALKRLTLTPEDHLFIEGGDGTMQRTLSCLLNILPSPSDCPKLSLIAGGLTNQIAANIGLKAARNGQIKAVIESPHKSLCPTPILKLADKDRPALYGCLFSTGALPFVTQYYEQKVRDSQAGGKTAIAATLIKAVSGSRAARDELMPATDLHLHMHEVESADRGHSKTKSTKTKTGPHLGTVVTTLPSLMMGLDPFWGEGTGPLRVFYAGGRARRLVRNLTGIWLGRKQIDRSTDDLESYCAQQLDYQYQGPALLDGEPLEIGAKFTLTATPPLPFVTSPK